MHECFPLCYSNWTVCRMSERKGCKHSVADPVLCHILPRAGTLPVNINKPLHQPRVVPCHQISIISAVKMAALLRAGEDNDADWACPYTGCDIWQSHRILCSRRVICGAGTSRGWRKPLWDWAACQSSWTLIGWNADWPCGAGSGYMKCLFLSTLIASLISVWAVSQSEGCITQNPGKG